MELLKSYIIDDQSIEAVNTMTDKELENKTSTIMKVVDYLHGDALAAALGLDQFGYPQSDNTNHLGKEENLTKCNKKICNTRRPQKKSEMANSSSNSRSQNKFERTDSSSNGRPQNYTKINPCNTKESGERRQFDINSSSNSRSQNKFERTDSSSNSRPQNYSKINPCNTEGSGARRQFEINSSSNSRPQNKFEMNSSFNRIINLENAPTEKRSLCPHTPKRLISVSGCKFEPIQKDSYKICPCVQSSNKLFPVAKQHKSVLKTKPGPKKNKTGFQNLHQEAVDYVSTNMPKRLKERQLKNDVPLLRKNKEKTKRPVPQTKNNDVGTSCKSPVLLPKFQSKGNPYQSSFVEYVRKTNLFSSSTITPSFMGEKLNSPLSSTISKSVMKLLPDMPSLDYLSGELKGKDLLPEQYLLKPPKLVKKINENGTDKKHFEIVGTMANVQGNIKKISTDAGTKKRQTNTIDTIPNFTKYSNNTETTVQDSTKNSNTGINNRESEAISAAPSFTKYSNTETTVQDSTKKSNTETGINKGETETIDTAPSFTNTESVQDSTVKSSDETICKQPDNIEDIMNDLQLLLNVDISKTFEDLENIKLTNKLSTDNIEKDIIATDPKNEGVIYKTNFCEFEEKYKQNYLSNMFLSTEFKTKNDDFNDAYIPKDDLCPKHIELLKKHPYGDVIAAVNKKDEIKTNIFDLPFKTDFVEETETKKESKNQQVLNSIVKETNEPYSTIKNSDLYSPTIKECDKKNTHKKRVWWNISNYEKNNIAKNIENMNLPINDTVSPYNLRKRSLLNKSQQLVSPNMKTPKSDSKQITQIDSEPQVCTHNYGHIQI